MNKIYDLIDELKFSNSVFPMTQEYANWETEQVTCLREFYKSGQTSINLDTYR